MVIARFNSQGRNCGGGDSRSSLRWVIRSGCRRACWTTVHWCVVDGRKFLVEVEGVE